MQSGILIRKSNGEKVPFDESKLRTALQRSGASETDIELAMERVYKILQEGISTRKIYHYAYQSLRKLSKHAAGRYRLKRAMLELGPSGYPFEKFVAKLLETQGYKCTVNVLQQGKCVSHELDVIAEKDNIRIMIECKYHSEADRKSDVKIPLYINSRFLDVKSVWEKENPALFYKGMVVTNTRFSQDAVDYAKCEGLLLVSWDYPRHNSLKYQIDKAGLHPITSLGLLKKSEKQQLLDKGIVLCRQLVENAVLLENMRIHKSRIKNIINEANEIIGAR